MVMTEATGVSPEARIGPCDLGLYSDANEQALKRIVDFNAEYGSAVMAIQLAHAGQKASVSPPWEGRKPLLPEDGGWVAVAPSAVPVADGWPEPQVLDEAGMAKVKADFAAAARRSDRIGFDVAEVHAAHGYLLHPVPVAGNQQAHRRLWRVAGQPHALSVGSVRRRPRGVAREQASGHPYFRHPTGSKAVGIFRDRWPSRWPSNHWAATSSTCPAAAFHRPRRSRLGPAIRSDSPPRSSAPSAWR